MSFSMSSLLRHLLRPCYLSCLRKHPHASQLMLCLPSAFCGLSALLQVAVEPKGQGLGGRARLMSLPALQAHFAGAASVWGAQ